MMENPIKMDDLGATQMDQNGCWIVMGSPAVAMEFTPFDQGLGDDVFDQEIWWTSGFSRVLWVVIPQTV